MTKDEALKMAIEQMKHLIKIYIPSPEWSGTAIQRDCYETIQACKEALEQHSGDVVVTKNEQGQIVCVTRQNAEGNILSVIAESEQPEVGDAEIKQMLNDIEWYQMLVKELEEELEALEQPTQRNFCERCGKRASKDPYHIHTCTPPQELEQPALDWMIKEKKLEHLKEQPAQDFFERGKEIAKWADKQAKGKKS